MHNRHGVIAMSAGMVCFVLNDTLVKFVSDTLPTSQLIFLRGLMAVLGFLAPSPSRGRMLHAGEMLGKGPYRRYDCTPTEQLVERITTSIERAAEELPAADRDRTVTIVSRARQHAAAGAFHEAVTAAAEAIAIHTNAVEAARGDVTNITPKSSAG